MSMASVNDDGVVDFYQFLLETAHEKDVTNSQQGIGMMGMLGIVVKGPPDIQIAMQGVISLTDENLYLSSASFDLLIPANLRLTVGDTVGLLPFKAEKLRWWVLGITRDPILQPLETARIGYDGDRNLSDPTAQFAGVVVDVPDGDIGSTSTTTISGQNISITSFGGANVTIDGINFKTHAHTDPQGGNTGPPH